MNFYDQVIGHEDEIKRLQSLVNEGKVPHGILFWGEDGIGKFKIAMAFATNLLAQGESSEEAKRTISRIKNGNHPDVTVLEREEGKNDISTSQIEEINKSCITLAEKVNGYRVFIIREADCMNEQAANRFLKTLEEPPKNVVFILVTSNRNSVLPTILSRCQQFFYKPLEFALVSTIISIHFRNLEQMVEEELISAANHLSGGRPGKVIEMINSNFEKVFETHNRFLNAKLPVSYESVLNGLEAYLVNYKGSGSKLFLQRNAFSSFLEYSALYYREFLLSESSRGDRCKLWDFKNVAGLAVDSKMILLIMELIEKFKRNVDANCNIGILTYAFSMSLSKTWNSQFLQLK